MASACSRCAGVRLVSPVSKTTKLFADVRTHTNHAGAELSAQVVASLLRGMKNIPVAGAMRATPAPAW